MIFAKCYLNAYREEPKGEWKGELLERRVFSTAFEADLPDGWRTDEESADEMLSEEDWDETAQDCAETLNIPDEVLQFYAEIVGQLTIQTQTCHWTGEYDAWLEWVEFDVRKFSEEMVREEKLKGVEPPKVGTHLYPGCSDPNEFYTSDCEYGCGCWLGSSRSGGPDGVDPFGECPKNTFGRAGKFTDSC